MPHFKIHSDVPQNHPPNSLPAHASYPSLNRHKTNSFANQRPVAAGPGPIIRAAACRASARGVLREVYGVEREVVQQQRQQQQRQQQQQQQERQQFSFGSRSTASRQKKFGV